jgi:peptidoglycan hydrolase CwlO-like protein
MRSITGKKESKKTVREWKETNLKNSENYVKNNFKNDRTRFGLRKNQFSQKKLLRNLQSNHHKFLIIVV